MSGRGKGWLVYPSSDASVKIGLKLSTSSATLSPSSPDPFYITVTARILSTPEPSRPITLQTYPSPLEELGNRSFDNITCTTDPNKYIEIYPRDWPNYHWDSEDLRSAWEFVTIPPPGQGGYVIHHEVPRDKIRAACLQKGSDIGLRTWKDNEDKQMERDNPQWAEERRQEVREKFGDGPSCEGEEPEMLVMVMEGPDAEFEIV